MTQPEPEQDGPRPAGATSGASTSGAPPARPPLRVRERATTRRSRVPGWTLRRRVTALLVAVSIVLVGSVVTITLNALQARESMLRLVEELGPARVAVTQLLSSYADANIAVRSYVQSGNPEFLDAYEQALTSQQEHLATLRDLARDNEQLEASLTDVATAAESWRVGYAQPAISLVQVGEDPTSEAYLRDRERGLFDDLRSAVQAAQDQIVTETESANDQLATATQQLIALLVLVGFVIVGLSTFVWVMLQNWVLRPLDELGRHLQYVADGYYDHHIELRASPEIERVARDVDSMRARIFSDLDEVATARRTLQEQSELLKRQTAELQRSNAELEHFAYVASHDLQEPLRKVASFCQLLQRRYHGQLDERADAYIDFAVEGAKRMQTLINGLLAFSRVGRTKNFTRLDLNSVLDDALRNLESAREETGATITSDQLPDVHGDRTLLSQVFFNLVGNAIKFRGEDPPRVHIGLRDEESEWVLCCSDNGIGIEAQYAERVFVLFQRLHTREKYGGTGIGLAMCKKIVEFHGGRIWLDTDISEGTRICWSLPKRSGPDEDEDTGEAEEADSPEATRVPTEPNRAQPPLALRRREASR